MSLQSSISSCSYQLQSVRSNTPDINGSSNSVLQSFGASNIWIMELRWHIESECSNILQSKVIPDIDIATKQSIRRKPPLSLSAEILEDKFGLVADCFQSIFRNTQTTKSELFFNTTTEKLTRIITIIHDMISLMRGDSIGTEEEDHSILIELTRIKHKVEKELVNRDAHINLKMLLSNLIEYGRILANLKQILIKFIIESFASFLRRQVRRRIYCNSYHGQESTMVNQRDKYTDEQAQVTEKTNILLSSIIGMIKRSRIYATVLLQSKGFHQLVKICGFSFFKCNWLLSLKLLTVLCVTDEAITQFEKHNGIVILCSLLESICASETVLAEAARLVAQITFFKIASVDISQSRATVCLDRWATNLEKLFNSLTMLCTITMSSSTFIVATLAINNLILLFPDTTEFVFHPRAIQIIVSACLSHKSFSDFARHNVITIIAHLSDKDAFEQVLIENNVIELSLQFLSDCIDDHGDDSCVWSNSRHHCSSVDHQHPSKKLEFIISLLRIIINLCCNEKNIDLLVENNDIGNFYVCHQHILFHYPSKLKLTDECLSILEFIIKNIENRRLPQSSRKVQDFLELDNAKESDV